MGNEHLTVRIELMDYLIESDIGSWGLARKLIEEYDLDSETQQKLIDPNNDRYVNLLQQRLVQENGGREQYSQRETIQVPRSKWQTMIVVGLIPAPPIQDGSNPPPINNNSSPEVIKLTRPTNEDLSEYIIPDKVDYFIVHDTAGELSKTTVNTYKTDNYNYDNCWRGHAYIFNDGTITVIVPFNESARATKTEWAENNKTLAWETMLHFELVYGNGSPFENQYNKLAFLYDKFYRANGRKLKIVPHREIDRGIPDGHSDPRNFDFNHFYAILKTTYGIEIIAGRDGITQDRYNYPNQADMVYNYPPLLSGRPERE